MGQVRPPLIELTAEQAKLLAAQLKAIGFAMNGIRRESKESRQIPGKVAMK